MADQIMAADKSRLKSRLGAVAAAEMETLDAAMMLHLGLAR
jgi:mRNA-degrading endonuclease toxin of MazEF toxin-antitoxin module